MQHSNQALYDALRLHLVAIDKQIDAITRGVLNTLPVNVKPDDDMVIAHRLSNGKYVLEDMLAAKAQILSAMASLKLEGTMSRQGQPRPGNGRGRNWG